MLTSGRGQVGIISVAFVDHVGLGTFQALLALGLGIGGLALDVLVVLVFLNGVQVLEANLRI